MTTGQQDRQGSQETVPADGVALDPQAMSKRVQEHVEAPDIRPHKATIRRSTLDPNVYHVGPVIVEALGVGPFDLHLVKQEGQLLSKVFTGLEDAVSVAMVYAHVWIPDCSDCGLLDEQAAGREIAEQRARQHELDHDGDHSVTVRQQVVA